MTTAIEETSDALIGEVMAAELDEVRELYVPNGLDLFINRIRAEVEKHDADISTERGRKAIASLARKVASSKVRLDDIGKDLVAELKAQTGKIDAERKRMRDALDALKDEVRKPLTDWENAEQARTDGHLAALAQIETLSNIPTGATSAEIREHIAALEPLASRDWQEFQKRYDLGLKAALMGMNRVLEYTEKHEQELEKIAQFQKQEAERAQREKEERIASEAREKAQREAEAEHQRIEQEKFEAEARARQADERRIAAEAQAKADAEAAEKRHAEQLRMAEESRQREAREAAERSADAARVAAQRAKIAAQKAEVDRKEAVEKERQRAAEEKRKAEEAEAKREANKKHTAKIDRIAIVALLESVPDLTEDQARTIVTVVAQGTIPAMRISY